MSNKIFSIPLDWGVELILTGVEMDEKGYYQGGNIIVKTHNYDTSIDKTIIAKGNINVLMTYTLPRIEKFASELKDFIVKNPP